MSDGGRSRESDENMAALAAHFFNNEREDYPPLHFTPESNRHHGIPNAPPRPPRPSNLREQVLSRVRRRSSIEELFSEDEEPSFGEVFAPAENHGPIEEPVYIEDRIIPEIQSQMQQQWTSNAVFNRQLEFFQSRNMQRREALMQSLRAYAPPPPFPNPELIEEIKPPVPVAVSQEHEAVCRAIDASDEYCGDLDVAPDQSFFCPVSQLALRNPVLAPDGYVYERSMIETSKKAANLRMVQWSSPMTRMKWGETTVFPQSWATVTAMRLWVVLKAVEVADASCTDDASTCAEKLISVLNK